MSRRTLRGGGAGTGTSVALSTVTAAGDLIVGTGAGTVARLAKGSPLQVPHVKADGTGLEYADAASVNHTDNPLANGTPTPGTSPTAAASDHVHPSSGTSGVLAVKSYNPSTQASYSTASNTLVDIDATNLITPAFTVPASGQVIVMLNGFYIGVASTNVNWGLRNGSTTVATAAMDYNASNIYRRGAAHFLVTGLTPAASVQLKWAHSVQSGATATSFSAGGPTGGNSGPAVMTVLAA